MTPDSCDYKELTTEDDQSNRVISFGNYANYDQNLNSTRRALTINTNFGDQTLSHSHQFTSPSDQNSCRQFHPTSNSIYSTSKFPIKNSDRVFLNYNDHNQRGQETLRASYSFENSSTDTNANMISNPFSLKDRQDCKRSESDAVNFPMSYQHIAAIPHQKQSYNERKSFDLCEQANTGNKFQHSQLDGAANIFSNFANDNEKYQNCFGSNHNLREYHEDRLVSHKEDTTSPINVSIIEEKMSIKYQETSCESGKGKMLSNSMESDSQMKPSSICSSGKSLSLPSDRRNLNPIHCLIRSKCIELFTASAEVAARRSKGKGSRPIREGQVGLRCIYCAHIPMNRQANQATSFPSCLHNIYESLRNWQRFHLTECKFVPLSIIEEYEKLRDPSKTVDAAQRSRNQRAKRARLYFATSAKCIGLKNMKGGGLCFDDSHLAIHSDNESHEQLDSDMSKLGCSSRKYDGIVKLMHQTTPGVAKMEDRPLITDFMFVLFSQLLITKASYYDKKRPNVYLGYPGLECRHCSNNGKYEGRYFPTEQRSLSGTDLLETMLIHLYILHYCF